MVVPNLIRIQAAWGGMLPEVKEVVLLLYSVLVRLNVGNTVSSSRFHSMREMKILERIQNRTTKIMKRLEHLSYEKS